MTPLDIPRLNWEDFLGSRPVVEAHRDLTARADRPVLLHNRALVPDVPNCFRTAWNGGIHIFIDPSSPRRDHSLVHELLHEILIAEGYHRIDNIPRELRLVRDILSNEMQHPEIFRRMEEIYRLEMEGYWEHWHNEMQREVDTMAGHARNKDRWLDHFPRVYTWFFQKVSAPYLAEYRERCPDVYQAVEAAAKETENVGFATAEKNKQSLGLFRERWIRFCERNLPRSCYGPPPHAVIEQSTIRPIIERDKAVTADNIMALLRMHGFRTA